MSDHDDAKLLMAAPEHWVATPKGGDPDEWPDDLRVQEWPA